MIKNFMMQIQYLYEIRETWQNVVKVVCPFL